MQRQLQIHLCRLPDLILQAALSQQLPCCLDWCMELLHPMLSQLLTQSAISQSPPELSQPVKQTTLAITQFPADLSQHVTHPASPFSPQAATDRPQKSLRLCLHRLPESVVQSALHKPISSSSFQQLQSPLHSAQTEVSTQPCFQESEVQHPHVLTETYRTNKDETVPVPPQTVDPDTDLQESKRDEQKDVREEPPEEEEEEEEEDVPVKETAPKNCPTIDTHSVLHSQNSAECASVNTLTGLTNGLPHKGLLQNKHKIHVDFKVGFYIKTMWQGRFITNVQQIFRFDNFL